MGAGEFFIGLPHCHRLAMTQTSSRNNKGDNFDWIREQFLDLYYLLKCHPISVCEELDHSALGHLAPSSFVL